MSYVTQPDREFIRQRVKVAGQLDCWLWQLSLDRDGYGRLGSGVPQRAAHRLSYVLFKGPIPDGMTVDHTCYVPSCVNPQHLRLLSIKENCARQRLHRNHTPVAASECAHGHDLTIEGNIYITPAGKRACRPCNKAACDRYRERRRALASKE